MSMLKLYGFATSNYYNKVKFVLLEKGIPFEEVRVELSADDALLGRSPLRKVPFIETEQGVLCESQVIVDYLEAAYPQTPLYPREPFAAAQQRELETFIDWHLEQVARNLYGAAFFGATVSDGTKTRVEKLLRRHIEGFKRIAKFTPYVGGASFGMADASAFVSLPVVGLATRAVYGSDFLLDAGIDWKTYVKLVGERAAAQKVTADRKRDLDAKAAAKAAAQAKP
jgi:glutathione S-transferase